ncbi:MAG: ester cyclase [Chloroflexi bacterium]|nr:ester cyclase [Chloroflexota bacterium]
MSERNKAIYREYIERFDKGELDVGRRFWAPDYRGAHMPGSPKPITAKEHEDLARVFYKAFPDLVHVIEDQITEGDRVVTRVTVKGTHTGEFQGISPTGKHVAFPVCYVAQIAGGKITEEWVYFDLMGFMQQIGAVPTAAQAAR